MGVSMSTGGVVRNRHRRGLPGRPTPRNHSQREGLIKWAKAYWLAFSLTALGLMVGAAGFFVGRSSVHFGGDLGKALLTLGSGLILSGAVKVLLDQYQEQQRRRDDDHALRERLLADLRDVYDRMERARLMVTAHKSGNTYFKHMKDLIGCEAVLLKFKRTLDVRGDSTKDVDPKSVCVPNVLGYLRALRDEYATNYMRVAECQRYDDEVTRRDLTKLVAEDAPLESILSAASHCTWDLLQDPKHCPVLHDMIGCGKQYTGRFLRPLNTVAEQLAGTTGSSRPLDEGLDHRVDGIARTIRSKLPGAVQPVQLRAEEEPAPAACPLSARSWPDERSPVRMGVSGVAGISPSFQP